jgi:hypothetical protein
MGKTTQKRTVFLQCLEEFMGTEKKNLSFSSSFLLLFFQLSRDSEQVTKTGSGQTETGN